jgi:hypothetical protein
VAVPSGQCQGRTAGAQGEAGQAAASGGGRRGGQGLLIKQCESGGDYTAVNASSGASGAYQFLDSTWQSLSPEEALTAV